MRLSEFICTRNCKHKLILDMNINITVSVSPSLHSLPVGLLICNLFCSCIAEPSLSRLFRSAVLDFNLRSFRSTNETNSEIHSFHSSCWSAHLHFPVSSFISLFSDYYSSTLTSCKSICEPRRNEEAAAQEEEANRDDEECFPISNKLFPIIS